VVVAAIDLGLIALVVPVTGGAGRDKERGYIGRGWSMRGSTGLVEDRAQGWWWRAAARVRTELSMGTPAFLDYHTTAGKLEEGGPTV
jgi:hypothetical protein